MQILHKIMSSETNYLSVQQGARVALLVNSLGSVMPAELHIAARAAIKLLQETVKASLLSVAHNALVSEYTAAIRSALRRRSSDCVRYIPGMAVGMQDLFRLSLISMTLGKTAYRMSRGASTSPSAACQAIEQAHTDLYGAARGTKAPFKRV